MFVALCANVGNIIYKAVKKRKAALTENVGAERGPSTVESISDTISKLERQRDEFKKAKELTGSSVIDKRINSLENRISNLEKRLSKLKEKDDGECQTCKNRKYQDDSDDPGVSSRARAEKSCLRAWSLKPRFAPSAAKATLRAVKQLPLRALKSTRREI